MMIKVINLLFFLLCTAQLFAQNKKPSESIIWLSPPDAQQLMLQEEKPLIIDVYTDWCHYCKLMDKTTWKNQQLKEYVSKKFYPVKFNAENKQEVNWQGQTYIYKQAYKVHMLAAEWLKGNMVFPSTVIIPKDGEPIVLPGMMTPSELEPILFYFGEGHYKTTAWEIFKAKYQPIWN